MPEIIRTPDLGVDSAEIIEILVAVGDVITKEQGLIVIESDKASMEVPSPFAGTIQKLVVKVGDTIKQGDELAHVESDSQDDTNTASAEDEDKATADKQQAPVIQKEDKKSKPTADKVKADQVTKAPDEKQLDQNKIEHADTVKAIPVATEPQENVPSETFNRDKKVYAGPGVWKLARELGVDLAKISGTGRNGRVLKEDVKIYIKSHLQQPATSNYQKVDIDFSQFGKITTKAINRMQELTSASMVNSWHTVPRVTQFDEADISKLEEFRTKINSNAKNKEEGLRLTLLSFLVRASVNALQQFPQFNVSINGNEIIYKHYFNIGIAVDTPAGLMVPVIRDADNMKLFEIAESIRQLASKARDKKLLPQEMQGGCFTISSLGGVGGTGFTPMVNHPEVAILGIANSTMKPVWDGNTFIPRLICPLSLSYDHRAVNGADSARFLRIIAESISDIRTLLL